MHIPDGMVPGGVCLAGYGGTAALLWISVRQTERKTKDASRLVSRASVMAAAFFVASWIHIPLPPASVHPLFIGLMGIVLGWMAFPAVLAGLFFQAVMFGHGGLTTLGVNSMAMGGPALAAGSVFRLIARGNRRTLTAGFAAGFCGVCLAAAVTCAVLLLTIPAHIDRAAEATGITALALAHLPLAVAEGIFTALAARFLLKVSPEMLQS